jgi:transposase
VNRDSKACNLNSHKGSEVFHACSPPRILFIYRVLLLFIEIFLHACSPPFIMPSLITKWKKGKPYLYWVRSAWVNGHSRIVEQRSLGPRERVMEQMHAPFTSASHKEIPALRTVQSRECGASALFSAVAQELGLIELINAHVPPAPPGRRTSLSVGHSLVLAALNRAAWPQSKRACTEWSQGTVLARLVPALPDEVRSQRFWDHMNLFASEPFAPIQRALLCRMHERFPLGAQFLVYDTTHDDPFIHPCNSRPSLPQRGKNKQKRAALRQLSLALVVDEERGRPLYYRCYEGNGTDVVALGASLQEMVGQFVPQTASPRLTLVLAKGNGSRDNFKALTEAHFSFLAAIPAGWVRRLYQGALQEYPPLTLPDGPRSQVSCQSPKRLAGIQGQLLVSVSPTFYRQPGRPLALLQRKATQRLLHLRAAIQQAVARNRPRTEKAVKGEIAQLGRHDRLKEFFAPTLHLHQGRGQDLRWQWDGRKKRAIKHRDFGQTVLFTDRQELEPHRMGLASRSQAKAEELLRISKSRRPGLWWPAYHWTDSKLSVHALYGFLALVLIRLVLLRLHARNLSVGVALLTERLRGIHEALGVYANGAAQRVITERSPEQDELFAALDVGSLAEQWGNRVLHT